MVPSKIQAAGSRYDCLYRGHIISRMVLDDSEYLKILRSVVRTSRAFLHKVYCDMSGLVIPSGHTYCQPYSYIVGFIVRTLLISDEQLTFFFAMADDQP